MAGTAVEERFAKLGLRDAETSFDPTRYRLYASNQGRWLSPDPVLGCPLHPENLNRYSYAANNPANLTDPQGSGPLTCPQAQAICQIGAIYCGYFVDYYFFPRCVGGCFDAYSACLGDPLVLNGTIPQIVCYAGYAACYAGCTALAFALNYGCYVAYTQCVSNLCSPPPPPPPPPPGNYNHGPGGRREYE